jgi:type III restriction enzyme
MEKNVFEGYGNNILIQKNRTYTEIAFEEWCENENHSVKYVYKNGDKGEEYFGIVYKKAFRRSHFYPDYIIQTENDDVWMIEAKGGITADGSSNNVDRYAKKKFDALKSYAEKHTSIKWGFIRAVGSQIYMSNTEWDENVMNRDVWKPIEDIVNEFK